MIADSPDTGPVASPLDRALEIRGVNWFAAAWLVVVAAALATRLSRLTQWGLSPAESHAAFSAWLIYQGKATPDWAAIPAVGPLAPLLSAFSYFLFGVTDATFRLPGAIAGVLLVLAPLLMRKAIGDWKALGMGVLAALSPILMYTSRAHAAEAIAALVSLGLVVAIVRVGAGVSDARVTRRWATFGGIGLGALLASGAMAPTILICLGVAIVVSSLLAPAGVVRICFARLQGDRTAMLGLIGALLLTAVVLFSRFFSDPGALIGLPETARDWFFLLIRGNSAPPSPVWFLAMILLYEPVAVLGAIAGHFFDPAKGQERSLAFLFAAWFVLALVLWSFSAGRAPEQAVHVALPLVMLGGLGVGALLQTIDWQHFWHVRGGLLALSVLGAFVAFVAVVILVGRAVNDSSGLQAGGLPAALVTMLALVPLVYACWQLTTTDRASGFAGQPARIAVLVFTILLGMYGWRSGVYLSFERAALGTEPLTGEVATDGLLASVNRLDRLSRDVSVEKGTARDVTGSYSLKIAIDDQAIWPWAWYTRNYPDVSVGPAANLANSGADVLIAANSDAITGGYTVVPTVPLMPRQSAWNDPDLGGIARDLLPDRWISGLRFLLFRENAVATPTEQAFGFSPELAARLSPTSGPYNLDDRPGVGSADGQFNQPIGIATTPDGTILVVDSGNGRVERFSRAGNFLDAWNQDTGLDLARTANGLGPTGITTDDAGNVYIADTWNHRVIVLDSGGNQLFMLGDNGASDLGGERQPTDTGDDPANVGADPGLFFGPRAVAVSADAIYVTDTGNERVQEFTRDGQFVRAFGGFGHGPSELVEPVGIAVGPDGNVYVADSGNARISVFTPDGMPVRQFPVTAWPAPDPTGARPSFQPYLQFTPGGLLLASSSQSGSVEVYDPTGMFVTAITQLGADQFQNPIGLALSDDGDLLVTDYGANAVLRGPLPDLPPARPLPAASPVASPAAPATPAATPVTR